MEDIIILAWGQSRWRCPFDADEVWGINNVWTFKELKNKRFDKIFAFDPWPEFNIREMKKIAPIVSWRDYADIKYPLEEIKAEFKTSYFTNTIAYMIAYAIFLKIPLVRLYGVDAPYGSKYAIDKSGVEYWIGRGIERGTEVIPCEGSHLLRTITGEEYGGEREGRVQLYFQERLNLASILPQKGHYQEISDANIARDVILPREFEAKEYGIEAHPCPDGGIRYTCDKEFAKDIVLPKEIWEYIAGILKDLEGKGELSSSALSLYEKLVLAPKREGM